VQYGASNRSAWQFDEADPSGMDEAGEQNAEWKSAGSEEASGDEDEAAEGYQPSDDESREARDQVTGEVQGPSDSGFDVHKWVPFYVKNVCLHSHQVPALSVAQSAEDD